MKYLNLCPHPVSVFRTHLSPNPYRVLAVRGYLRLDYEHREGLAEPDQDCEGWRPVKVKDRVLLRLDDDVEAIYQGVVLVVSAIVGVSSAAPDIANRFGVYVVSPGRALWRNNRLVGCVGLRHWASPPSIPSSNTARD